MKFYYKQLDGLRTLAFLMVFSSHAGAYQAAEFSPIIQLFVTLYNTIASVGWMGVDIFFTLSAFLITSILLKEEENNNNHFNLRWFLYRRVLRIWPIYFLATVTGLALFPFITSPALAEFGTHEYWHYVKTSFLWMSTFTLNIGVAELIMMAPTPLLPLWSISLEEQFYLFWGSFLKIIKKPKGRYVLIGTLFIITLTARWYYQHYYRWTHIPFYENTLSRLDPLLFGAGFAFLVHYKPYLLVLFKKIGFLFFFSTILLFISQQDMFHQIFQKFHLFDLTIADITCLLLFISALTFSPLIKLFSLSWIAKYGRLTYGMYVFHFFVINTLDTLFLKNVTNFNYKVSVHLIAGLPLTFLIAYVVWHLFEKRFLMLKNTFSLVETQDKEEQPAIKHAPFLQIA